MFHLVPYRMYKCNNNHISKHWYRMVLIWHERSCQGYERSGFSLLCWASFECGDWQRRYLLCLLFGGEVYHGQSTCPEMRCTVDIITLTTHPKHVICHWCHGTVRRLQRRAICPIPHDPKHRLCSLLLSIQVKYVQITLQIIFHCCWIDKNNVWMCV